MKTKPRFLLYALILFSFSCRQHAISPALNGLETRAALPEGGTDLLHEHVLDFPNHTQLALALIRDSSVAFYGLIRERDTLFYRENHDRVFEIGSISKVFTAALLAWAVVEDRVALDDPVSDYWEVVPHDTTRITFQHLANHTSGLPRLPPGMMLTALLNADNPYRHYDEAHLETYISEKLAPKKNPGEAYEYSNLGAGLLGYTLSKIYGDSYGELLAEKILRPLEMSHSGIDRKALEVRLVRGLNSEGEEVSNWDLAALAGAGAILSTSADLAKFALAQFDTTHQAYALTREKTFAVRDGLDMGLGWHIRYPDPEHTWYWHNGGTGGYCSSMVLDIARRQGVIILSNVSAFHEASGRIDDLCLAMMKQLEKVGAAEK